VVSNVRLPILDERAPGAGSLGKDGRRRRPYPADVSGRFLRWRRVVYAGLVALWAALPWVPIGGHPAVFLDVPRRQFFLFGGSFNAQDVWLLCFLVTGLGFGLIFLTALLGRVWCGWICPQTVFVEALFRPIERLLNGPRNVALKRNNGPLTFGRAWRTACTHGLYVAAALLVSHVFLAYFVSLPELFAIVRANPGGHPEVFGWMLATTALFYVSFGVFREQFCVVVCPYGRLQSVFLDDDSLVVGYDGQRGEPRGKATQAGRGDCVNCNRCVVVCPTGIDIRDGLQLDCVACTACIDACDAVMDRLEKPRGLVRYDSLRGLRGERRRILRPRVVAYVALLLLGLVSAATAARAREPFEANLLRLPGPPYSRDGGRVRNGFEVHLVNKSSAPVRFDLTPAAAEGMEFIVPIATVQIEPLGSRRLPLFVSMNAPRGGDVVFVLHVVSTGGARRDVKSTFIGGE